MERREVKKGGKEGRERREGKKGGKEGREKRGGKKEWKKGVEGKNWKKRGKKDKTRETMGIKKGEKRKKGMEKKVVKGR